MEPIRVAIAGVGNCASALVQGVAFYSADRRPEESAGLMHPNVGGWLPHELAFVAAFDVDERKVGLPLEEAVFAPPNCAAVFQSELAESGVRVAPGPVLDGVAAHMLSLIHI